MKAVIPRCFEMRFVRSIIILIGLNCRYWYFKLLGKKVTFKMLTTGVINSNSPDYDPNGRYQSFANGFVGFAVIIAIIGLAILIF